MHIRPISKRKPAEAADVTEVLDIITYILNVITQVVNLFTGISSNKEE